MNQNWRKVRNGLVAAAVLGLFALGGYIVWNANAESAATENTASPSKSDWELPSQQPNSDARNSVNPASAPKP